MLVHDYLTQAGGAERVLTALHGLWPDAPVLTAVADRATLPDGGDGWEVRDHAVGRNALARREHRLLLPLYPAIFRRLGHHIRDVDVVVSDSSAWSHRIEVPEGIPHVCYCHSPARFLWNDPAYVAPAGLPRTWRFAAAPMLSRLRQGDQAAALRVDQYMANSRAVAERIRAAYGIEAPVVYPPVDVARFRQGPDPAVEDWFLMVSRLVPHKRIDLAIDACHRIGARLKIIGSGRQEADLRRLAGPDVTFLGALPDDVVAGYMRRCKALVIPAVEDFGITAVEVQAAGRPVVAYGEGGALESVIDHETGLFFHEKTAPAPALAAALLASAARRWSAETCRENADRFRTERFQAEMLAMVEQTMVEQTMAKQRRLTACCRRLDSRAVARIGMSR